MGHPAAQVPTLVLAQLASGALGNSNFGSGIARCRFSVWGSGMHPGRLWVGRKISEQMRDKLIQWPNGKHKTGVMKSGCAKGNGRLARLETDSCSEARATHGRDAQAP
jgi:hypothetical protein